MDDLFSREVPELLQRHFDVLGQGSGLSVAVIKERGYRSVLGAKELRERGFGRAQQRQLPGLLLPVWTPDGTNPLCAYRPDFPRVDARNRELKYEIPVGVSARLDVPPRCRPLLRDPAVPLWMSEGQKKGDALATHGLCTAVLLGVWNFKGRNELGGTVLLADFDLIAWNGRLVYIVFDSDLMRKKEVRAALDRLTEHLRRKGATVVPVYLPPGPDGRKVGVDDYLLAHSVAELEALAAAPRPEAKPAPPAIELLDEAPADLRRPLALIDGHAYAATWLWIKRTVTEALDRDGQVVRLDPPRVEKARALFVVRDDGVVLGPGEAQDLEDLGIEVILPEVPPDSKLWRARSVAAYRRGLRPDVADVFRRLVRAYDHFLDFGPSLGTQDQMCELSACFSLATWLAAAFTVLGYPWPNGDWGSGKTKWGTIWAMTSYLGTVLLSSATFAALRDLADYGAALLFDDAEGLANPKTADPLKRELLLAGNRRGAAVALKEPAPDGTWRTRWVDAYCPRGFTAIKLPDRVLLSRSIILPLVKTDDAERGNRDPADVARWPCDQRGLQDDLWSLGLWLLPEAERVWAELDAEVELVGRAFEPWRALIVVARLLERHGVQGLEGRIRALMRAYQKEKADLLEGDWTTLVIKALLETAFPGILERLASDTSDTSDTSDGLDEELTVSAAQIAETVKCLVAEEGDGEADWATPDRIGRIFSQLRLKKDRQSTKQRGRVRTITRRRILALARAYGALPTAGTPDQNAGAEPGRSSEAGDGPPTEQVSDVSNASVVSDWTDGEAEGSDADRESVVEDELEYAEWTR
jgi:hypothetical protein